MPLLRLIVIISCMAYNIDEGDKRGNKCSYTAYSPAYTMICKVYSIIVDEMRGVGSICVFGWTNRSCHMVSTISDDMEKAFQESRRQSMRP